MQHINRIDKFSYVKDPERSGRISNPNFLNASPNDGHRFPVVRLKSLLHLVELITRFAARRGREAAQISESAAPELNWLAISHRPHYTKYCMLMQAPMTTVRPGTASPKYISNGAAIKQG